MVTDLEEMESTIEDDEPKIETPSVLDPDLAVSREHKDERNQAIVRVPTLPSQGLKYGKKKFEKICYRLLSLANLDEKTADSFVIAHEDDSNGIWDWDRCEQAFVDSALTPLGKAAEVDEFAKAGKEKAESYKALPHNLRRLVDVYKVRELPKHADVTQALRMTIPSQALTLIRTVEIVKMLVKHTSMTMPDTTTLDSLMESIPNVDGPDECTKWKTVIDAAKKSRAMKELEEAKITQQAKEKGYQKKVAAQLSATGTVEIMPPPPLSRSRYRGSGNPHHGGQGGRSHPYPRGGNGGESHIAIDNDVREEGDND
ncbi:hypothetical protein BGZ98_005441 [Dissophora globulifera]|nr:hypothetical protein BGZ98_005441 [Dissophora globulifera]